MKSEFEVGAQPCQNFTEQDELGIGVGNRHTCYGSKGCEKAVSFCTNCNTDHHEDGWQDCWILKKNEVIAHNEARIKRLEEALRFFADNKTDEGNVAREALKPATEGKDHCA